MQICVGLALSGTNTGIDFWLEQPIEDYPVWITEINAQIDRQNREMQDQLKKLEPPKKTR